jgi:hypothetical protein
MKRWLLVGGIVVVVLVGLLLFGLSNLGPIIQKAVNSQGPKVTGTEVRVADVDVALFSGRAALKNFYLGNPKGFKSPSAMSVAAIEVDVDEKSLTGDTVVIDRIEVIAPRISYEKGRGGDNFQALMRNVQRAVGHSGQKSSDPSPGQAGKKFLIRDFVVRDGQVNLILSEFQDKEISASLPDIRLRNIGEKNGGVTSAEAAREIFNALYGKITSAGVSSVLQEGLQGLGSSAQSVREGVDQEVKKVGETATQEMESARQSLKGLLGD